MEDFIIATASTCDADREWLEENIIREVKVVLKKQIFFWNSHLILCFLLADHKLGKS